MFTVTIIWHINTTYYSYFDQYALFGGMTIEQCYLFFVALFFRRTTKIGLMEICYCDGLFWNLLLFHCSHWICGFLLTAISFTNLCKIGKYGSEYLSMITNHISWWNSRYDCISLAVTLLWIQSGWIKTIITQFYYCGAVEPIAFVNNNTSRNARQLTVWMRIWWENHNRRKLKPMRILCWLWWFSMVRYSLFIVLLLIINLQAHQFQSASQSNANSHQRTIHDLFTVEMFVFSFQTFDK